jgi:hypothetical protein
MKKILLLAAFMVVTAAAVFGQCSVIISGQTDATCYGLCDGTATALASGGSPPYTYVWSHGPNTQIVSGLCAGTYSVTITDALMCNASTDVIINQPPAISIYTISGGGICCVGSSGVNITLSGSEAGIEYQLLNNSSPTGSPIIGTGATLIWTGLTSAGTYTISAANSTTGCSMMMSGSASVTVSPLPNAYNMTGGGNYCSGGMGVNVMLSSSQMGVNYQLFIDGSPFGAPVAGIGNSLMWPGSTMPGTYTVVATNSTSGCTSTMNGSANVGVMPNPVADAGADQVISSATSTTLSGNASGGSGTYSYLWAPSSELVDANVQNPSTVSLTATTTFYVTVTDMTTGCTGTAQVIITIAPPLTLSPTATPNVLCIGQSASLSANANGGTGTYTYTWDPPMGLDNPNIANPTASPGATTTYFVTVDDGLSNTSGLVTLTVNPVPMPSVSNSGPYCEGDAISLSATGGTSFSWSGPQGFTSTVQNPYLPSATTLMSGTYTVTATNPFGCTATATTSVSVNPSPVADAGSDAYFCSLSGMLNAVQGIGSGAWSQISGPGTSVFANPNAANTSVNVSIAGVYTFEWEEAYSGCYGSDQVVITFASVASLSGTVSFSGGAIATGDARVYLIMSGASGGHQITDSVLTGSSGSYAFQNLIPGDYYVYVKIINSSSYPNVLNSYNDSTYKWSDAQVISLICGMDSIVDITMYESTPVVPGNGQISGVIALISGTGTWKAVGEPVEGAEVFVEQQPNDTPIAFDNTDASGYYEMNNLPAGSYDLYVDIPGFPMLQTYSDVIVSATDTLYENLNFYVDTTSTDAGIYTEDITSIQTIITPGLKIEIFPNPAGTSINVISESNNEKTVIEIIDAGGKVLLKSAFSEHMVMDISDLVKGSYFLKATSGKTVIVKKIIKE